MSKPNGPQFKVLEEDDGPYCPNCSDSMDDFYEWIDPEREQIHPKNRIPCTGCGAI